SGGGLRAYAFGQSHRLVGAVFEFDGHEHHFTVAEIFKIVHLERAFAISLVARFARLIGIFYGGAVMDVLTAVAARHRRPKIIQHMAVETDALAGSETNDPDTRPVGFRQQRGADARIWTFGLALELSGDICRPLRFVLFLGSFVEHGQGHGNSSDAICVPI